MSEKVQNWPKRCSDERWKFLAAGAKQVGEDAGVDAARAAVFETIPRARCVVGIEGVGFSRIGPSFFWGAELNDGVWVYDGYQRGSVQRWNLDALNWGPIRRWLEEARPWRFNSVAECSTSSRFKMAVIYVYVYLDGQYSQFAYLRVWPESYVPIEPGDEPNPSDDENELIEMIQGLTKWKA